MGERRKEKERDSACVYACVCVLMYDSLSLSLCVNCRILFARYVYLLSISSVLNYFLRRVFVTSVHLCCWHCNQYVVCPASLFVFMCVFYVFVSISHPLSPIYCKHLGLFRLDVNTHNDDDDDNNTNNSNDMMMMMMMIIIMRRRRSRRRRRRTTTTTQQQR